MSKMIPVEGRSGLYRDEDSTAIVNRDKKAYLEYMKRKKAMQNKNNELDQMKEDLDKYGRILPWHRRGIFISQATATLPCRKRVQ